jgi:hypothetical protein
MAALLKQDEAAAAGSAKKVAKPKKDKNDESAMLKAVMDSAPKTMAQKEAEGKKALTEERKKKESEAAELKAEKLAAEEAHRRKLALKGIVLDHTDDLLVPINNRLPDDDEEEDAATGLDGALGVMSFGGKADEHPERRQKVFTFPCAFYTCICHEIHLYRHYIKLIMIVCYLNLRTNLRA